MELRADCLCKTYDGQTVLKDISFSVQNGETLAIVGRSGCGKTTLLRILAGLLAPDRGMVWLDGQPAGLPGKERLMVFQSFDQLFPWLTLRGNIRYALQKTRPTLGSKGIHRLAERCLAQMELGDAGGKYPYQLSGGMKQRGALARAMAISPKVLLLDEPFSSLDALTRENVLQAFQTLKQATDAAVVLVTHDLEEAVSNASQIALLHPAAGGTLTLFDNRGVDRVSQLKRLLAD